jgi:hypothetical protein
VLTLHRLPRAYRVLYTGISVLLAAALLSHWCRLVLRQGWTPVAVVAWYRGAEQAMLFRKASIEVAQDAWMNLFHHTLAFLVLGGLLVRTDAARRAKAILGSVFGAGTLVTAAGPALVWWGVPGSATLYVAALAALSGVGLVVCFLVTRDALTRRAAGHRGLSGSDVLTDAGTSGWGDGVARALVLSLGLLSAYPPVRLSAQAGVFLTEGAALREAFPAARWTVTDTLRPDSAARADLERRLGRPLYEAAYVFRRVYGAAAVPALLGYALVTEERGKYRPITMFVAVDTAGRVAAVRVMTYREPRGGEVARQFFLRQYRGKVLGDPIRINRDIINVSGATISVHSVSTGVRKTLALVERYYPRLGAPAPAALRPLSEVP